MELVRKASRPLYEVLLQCTDMVSDGHVQRLFPRVGTVHVRDSRAPDWRSRQSASADPTADHRSGSSRVNFRRSRWFEEISRQEVSASQEAQALLEAHVGLGPTYPALSALLANTR